MNSSPERGTFQRNSLLKRVAEGTTTAEHAEEMIEFHNSFDQIRQQRESDPQWRENNLEYDLRSTQWICDKAKAREEYAQNIYAALCNQSWQKNAVWPLLKGQTWSCSWRYAGGIVADMREQGDYMDWYCTGIRSGVDEADLLKMSEKERARYEYYEKHFVGEGKVTDEIRTDFFRLGWIPYDEDLDNQL